MATEYFDVLIIGAGLSGIGAACHLKKNSPDKTFAILEGRDAIGGTWDLFRYPGIRSDSDMFTLGYTFKPWTNRKGIADGADIRDYIREAAAEHQVVPHIRFGHKIRALNLKPVAINSSRMMQYLQSLSCCRDCNRIADGQNVV